MGILAKDRTFNRRGRRERGEHNSYLGPGTQSHRRTQPLLPDA